MARGRHNQHRGSPTDLVSLVRICRASLQVVPCVETHPRHWPLVTRPSALIALRFGRPRRCVPVPGRAGGRGLLQSPEGRREDAGPRVRDS